MQKNILNLFNLSVNYIQNIQNKKHIVVKQIIVFIFNIKCFTAELLFI